MSKTTLFTFLILLLFSTQAIVRPVNLLNYSTDIDTIFSKNQLIVRNASQKTLEIAELKNGKKHGKQTLFYDNGEVKIISNFKNGLLNGKVEYFSHGKKHLARIEHYKAFLKENTSYLHGVYKRFDSRGDLSELINYKKGEKNGKYKLYHNNGKLKEEGTYKDNLNIGNRRTYSTDGILLSDENYIIIDNPKYIEPSKQSKTTNEDIKRIPNEPKKLSVLNGQAKYYYSNSNLSADFTFRNGKKDGLCKEYHQDKNNTLKSEVVFKDGLEHGKFVYYHSNGNVQRKGIFYREIKVGDTILTNVYDGTIEVYQNNGKRSRIENWKNFQKNGVQEEYSSQTGKLSERSFLENNMLTGALHRFDKEGNLIYEAFYQIVNKNGQNVSQQIGTETYWKNGAIIMTVEWKEGSKNGVARSYYTNGQLEKKIYYKNGKLHGSYQTFYKNGQLKEDYNKKSQMKSGSSIAVDWNTSYDESGNIVRKFFADKNGKILIEHNFENQKRKEIYVNEIFRLTFSETHELNSIHWLNWNILLGFDLFSNQQLRRIYFSLNNLPTLTANFASNGDVIQIKESSGKNNENKTAIEMAEKIAKQYNPKWKDENLASDDFPDGKYQWKYADGSSFFEIEFKDDLPQGNWLLHNPIINDTLFYCEFDKGIPFGKLVRKKIDGTPEIRLEYFPNYQLKESYKYGQDGMIHSVTINDSLGNKIYSEEYYPEGTLKNMNFHTHKNSFNFSKNGDTSYYYLWKTEGDSIYINRHFFTGNKIKSDRLNNLTTGIGYSKTYFENGQLQNSHEMYNDKAHGVYQKFDENGNLLILGHFKEGERHGQWVKYNENGKEEISYFENGKISLEAIAKNEIDKNGCRCYDTSLVGSKIGFANLLNYYADYRTIKPYIPKSIIPINDWNYDDLFYINFMGNHNRNNGSTNLKLLLFNDFAFHYPTKDHLNISLNPCKTEGYIGNMDFDVGYYFNNQEIIYSKLSTKRISVGLENNPLVNANDKSIFKAYFDTDGMSFNSEGIETIYYPKDKNECYPLGIINDFMEIQIDSTDLRIDPTDRLSTADLPLLDNEIKQFYGLEISSATIKFKVDTVGIEASCDKILAGANYVAGRIFIDGKLINKDEFAFGTEKTSISIKKLQNTFEQKGFYRVNIDVTKRQLAIKFYAEN